MMQEKLVYIVLFVIILVVFLIFSASLLSSITGILGSKSLGMIMFVRQSFFVEPLKSLNFHGTIGLENLGDLVIQFFQDRVGKILPESNLITINITEEGFQTCEVTASSKGMGDKECDDMNGLEKIEIDNEIAKFTINDVPRIISQGKYYLTKYDLTIEYDLTTKTAKATTTTPGILKQIHDELQRCYDLVYLTKEGDPLYKSAESNPYLCSIIILTTPDKYPQIDYTDINAFLKKTINPDTKLSYGSKFKPLQINYCFETTTCLRSITILGQESGIENSYGKTCFSRETLDLTGELSISDNFQEIYALGGLVIPGIGFVFGGIIGSTIEEKLECDLETMDKDFDNTEINNKIIRIYYFDDNGGKKISLGDTGSINGAQLKGCSNALVLGTENYDYLKRQVDPLIICVEDII